MKKIEHKFEDKDIFPLSIPETKGCVHLHIKDVDTIYLMLSDLEALAKAMGKRLVDNKPVNNEVSEEAKWMMTI